MFPLTKENQRQTHHYNINQLHSVRDALSLARTRDLIFMCCTVLTMIRATIIIRFLIPARNDCWETTVTTSTYSSYMLRFHPYVSTNNSTMPAIRHPWPRPGTLSSCALHCRLGQVQTIFIRFLVPARNDGVAKNAKDYTFVLVIKRRAVL